jgi:hypothetical protein
VDRPSPEQIARYRAMTPAQRLEQATKLYWMARRLREVSGDDVERAFVEQ